MDPTQVLVAVGVIVVLLIVSKKLLGGKKPTAPSSNEPQPPKAAPVEEVKKEEKPVFFDKTRKTVPLTEVIHLTHDTRLFRFGLPTPDTVLGLPIGKHFRLHCPNSEGVVVGQWNGLEDKELGKAEIQRSYTPTSSDDDLGHFDLVVKVYKGGVIERFPDGGKASQYLESLKVGDSIDVSGPFGLVQYMGNGVFEYKRKPIQVKNVGMIAGGTGITPMLQIIAAVLKNPKDTTKLSLLFANQTENDILVRDQLEEYQKAHPDRLSVWYTLDRPPEDWKYSTGFVSSEMISAHLPAPADDTLILMCGPPVMITRACVPNLTSLGHKETALISF